MDLKNIKLFKGLLVSSLVLFFVSGCSLKSDDGSNYIKSIKGSVVDAEISDATVFLDLNGNFKLDGDEPWTKTDKKGNFILKLNSQQAENSAFLEHKALLVAYGGRDIRTKKIFTEFLSAAIIDDNKDVIITPISTLASQWLLEDLKNSNSSLAKEKLNQIYANLADILQVNVQILLENPIKLSIKGDITALKIETKLNKATKILKKVLKAELRRDKHAIFYTYRAVAKELKALKKDAKKRGDKVLQEAIESALDDNKLYAQTLKKEIKKEINSLIKSIDNYFDKEKEKLKENGVDDFLNGLEDSIDDEDNGSLEEPKDITPPTIILNGENPYILEIGNIFTDPGAKAVDNRDGELNVTRIGAIDINKLGDYTLIYQAIDSSGNESNVTRVVKVVDTIPPTLKLKGTNPLFVDIGDKFKDPGVESSDNSKEPVKVTVTGDIDTTKLGEYKLIYIGVDSSGNESNVTRIVKVVDTIPPTIELNGEEEVTVILGNKYKELGAKAIDNLDGNVDITINGDVNSTKIGDYIVEYSAVDSKGNRAVKSRVVHIASPEIMTNNLNVQHRACGNFEQFKVGNYTFNNNTWGRKQVPEDEDWVQCAFSYLDANGSLKGGFYWGWPNGKGGVKGYPEVIYGKKFRGQRNPESGWPIKVSDMKEVFVDIAYRDLNFTGSYNIAPEWWLHLDKDTSMSNIKYEIMVRLDPDGFHPHNPWIKDVNIDGIVYDVYKDEPWGENKRQFFNFVAHKKIKNIKLHPNAFMNFLYKNGISDIPNLYYADIEMGVEVIKGSGLFLIDKISVLQANKPITSIKVAQDYSYIPDLNDTSLTYTIANKPEWADFDETNGKLSGVPDEAKLYKDIEINATNGVQTFQVAKFDLNVLADNISQ